MADISKIKLPDGNTYDIVPEKVTGSYLSGVTNYYLVAYDEENKVLKYFEPDTASVYGYPCMNSQGIVWGGDFRNHVLDMSSYYTPSKTSGNWSIGSDDGVYRINAYRAGNLVQILLTFHGNGSAVSSGSNGFVGAIRGGPLPKSPITLTGFYSSSLLAATLETDGSLTVRPFSASCTLSSASRAELRGTFLTDSYE